MKFLSVFRPAVLSAVIVLLSAASCSDRSGQASSALAAADSLMLTQPQAALDTLSGIDSTRVRRMDRSERSFYTLLTTEAEYKCWLPVAEDTAISEAVRYYRRHGPEDRLARALTMQGAVLSERGDAEGAMAAYKEAEPITERGGDLEQLGLINTRIGELYQKSFINDSAAIARYRKALSCFEEAELPERTMYAHTALANILIIDSAEQAIPHLEEAVRMAELYGDRTCGLSALLLMMYIHESNHDESAVLNTADTIFSKFGRSPKTQAEESIYRNVLINLAKCYLRTGLTDSAGHIAGTIHATSPSDSLSLYNLYAGIAGESGDWKRVSKYQTSILRLTADILQANASSRLAEVERKYDNALLREELYRRDARNARIITAFILTAIAAITIIYILYRLTRRMRAKNSLLDSQLDSLKSENEENLKDLKLMLQGQVAANSELMRFYSRIYNAMMEIVSAYINYKDNPNSHLFSSKALEIAHNFTNKFDSLASATELLNTAYPSFLDTLFKDYPSLKPEERHIVILTCCGCPNHVVCSLLKISDSNLSTKKTRIAKKMGATGSLAKFLKIKLISHRANIRKELESFSQNATDK